MRRQGSPFWNSYILPENPQAATWLDSPLRGRRFARTARESMLLAKAFPKPKRELTGAVSCGVVGAEECRIKTGREFGASQREPDVGGFANRFDSVAALGIGADSLIVTYSGSNRSNRGAIAFSPYFAYSDCLSAPRNIRATAEDLCLACGLCCNGVIFADVRLQLEDSPEELRALGLTLSQTTRARGGASRSLPVSARPASAGLKFCQPCAAFDGCRCSIYRHRPAHCAKFECRLRKKFQEGRLTASAALDEIGLAKQRVDVVETLLRQLGDTDEHLPLAARFRRTRKRLEKIGAESSLAQVYGQLTLAFHDLNVVLSNSFYP